MVISLQEQNTYDARFTSLRSIESKSIINIDNRHTHLLSDVTLGGLLRYAMKLLKVTK